LKKALQGTLIAVGAAVLLSACSTPDHGAIMAMKPSTAFARALKLEYANLVEEEAAEVDWGNANLFATKAIAAGNNQQVLPEVLANHDRLPADSLPDLEAGRYWLTSALRDGARLRAPYDAGKAQAMFDCWVEEQEENHQPADIALCRHAFEMAMESVDKTLYAPKPMAKAAPAPKKAAPAPKAKPKKKAMPAPIPGPFVVYFDFDSSKIVGDAEKVIVRAVRAAQTRTSGPIVLRAHADKAGKNRYNAILSGKRAKAVIAALADWGISSDRVSVMSVGEEEPAISTKDGERESLNRRVVITLK
jgi:outer membrane protein OmpA-like peptidoglycan-associated protein